MRLTTIARDCLYLNWAVPFRHAPSLPEELTYDLHFAADEEWIFVSALLFRFVGLRAKAMPLLRFSYPQLNLRTYVCDRTGSPAVLYLKTFVPLWMLPVTRLAGRQRSTIGRFDYASPGRQREREVWSWALLGDPRFRAEARLASPAMGPGPALGSWDQTVGYFQRRRKGYSLEQGRLRSVVKTGTAPTNWPLQAGIVDSGLLVGMFPSQPADHWNRPHSAWLCPEIPFSFEVGKSRLSALRGRRPIAAAVSDC